MFGQPLGGAATSPAANPAAYNPNKDLEVASPPTDSISSLGFSPVANHLVATSWDNQVRCWEVAATGQAQPKAATQHDQPALCSAWSPDGATVFSGGCDNQVKAWSLATNQSQVVAKHDAPINQVKMLKDLNLLVTGSWDKRLRYWDLRSPTPVHTQQLPERVYALDARHPLLVVGLANRKIQIYNLTNPGTLFRELDSPLKHQTRCITCFPDASGFLVGSVEGRVAVQHIDDALSNKNFTFKDGSDVYAVSAIQFHPQFGTFVTTGGDGSYNFWDKDSKQRLKAMTKSVLPITCAGFNRDGTILAYAISYDWSRGYAEYTPANQHHHIMLHSPSEVEVKARARTSSSRR